MVRYHLGPTHRPFRKVTAASASSLQSGLVEREGLLRVCSIGVTEMALLSAIQRIRVLNTDLDDVKSSPNSE
jgi:hypothetical protein